MSLVTRPLVTPEGSRRVRDGTEEVLLVGVEGTVRGEVGLPLGPLDTGTAGARRGSVSRLEQPGQSLRKRKDLRSFLVG